eukprot:1600804-Rhodomonas_salina.5
MCAVLKYAVVLEAWCGTEIGCRPANGQCGTEMGHCGIRSALCSAGEGGRGRGHSVHEEAAMRGEEAGMEW